MHPDPALIGSSRLERESGTREAGRRLAPLLAPGDVLFLEGELGAGKSTLARSVLHALGWSGHVRSPSYALVRSYRAGSVAVHHLDLYRIRSAEEAFGLDLDELVSPASICLVEWPDRLEGTVHPTWIARLEIDGDARRMELFGPRRPGIEAILAPPNQETDP